MAACAIRFIIYTLINLSDGQHTIIPGDGVNIIIADPSSTQNITCPVGLDCKVLCDSIDACKNQLIQCPSDFRCEVHCINPNADGQCRSVTIHAEESSYLFINASVGNLPDSFNRMGYSAIHCPENNFLPSFGQTLCEINCDGNDIMRQSSIYSVQGFSTVDITSIAYPDDGGDLWCYRAGRMNCGSNYSLSCVMTSVPPFECNTAEPICENYTLTYAPTHLQTEPPTTSPTNTPSEDPTTDPTSLPTQSPTTCYDLDGAYTNDGYEDDIADIIASLTFANIIPNISEKVITTKQGQFIAKRIRLMNDNKKQLNCETIAGCSGADIIYEGNTICNLMCNEFASCAAANVDILECKETEIICDGDQACEGMTVNIQSFNARLEIKCGQTSSCNDMVINIESNIHSNVSCIGINSCDSLTVNIDSDYYKTNFLNMYSYSSNITFSNGQGFEESYNTSDTNMVIPNSTPFVTCNINRKYIQWNSSIDISDSLLKQSILSEYANDQFPCDDVTIECAQHINDTSSCELHFDITKIPNITDPSENACYWVPIANIIEIKCDGDCQASPTLNPTQSPTNAPSIPTNGPTTDPTQEPTYPSMAPTISPVAPPTSAPTQPPTTAPSNSPVIAPTGSPSQTPTAAPTRMPTQNVDKLYDVKIYIEYSCYNLNAINKQFIVENLRSFISRFQEIVEVNYFDSVNGLIYNDFWVLVMNINDKPISFSDQRQLSEDTLTVYDLDINNITNRPMTVNAKIECADSNGEIIIKKSETNAFQSDVTRDLQEYFRNPALRFTVSTANEDLVEIPKFPAVLEDDKDWTAIYISILIVSVGIVISFAAFVFNKLDMTKVDNAKYFMPALVALAVWDFVSDIILSIEISKNEKLLISMANIHFLLALASILFIILPFICNLWHAMRINSQETIQKSPSARAWFGNHLPQFILLSIACAGTYPALGLTNSRLFGLDFFNAGLLSSELHELSKIKIRSTIFMENVPQLIIQVIYSYVIGSLETATILAFIASSLSIIASLVIYYAQKEQHEKFITMKYFLRLEADRVIGAQSQMNIKCNKGLKEKLRDSLCAVFNISNKSIEIGFVTQNDRGCRIHLQHSIFKSDLEKVKKKLLASDNNYKSRRGYKIEITEEMYMEQILRINL